MSQLSNVNIDDFLVTPDNDNDNLALFNDVEEENDISQTDIVLLSTIEKGVVNRHEISVLFETFTDTDANLNSNKVGLSNLFVFVCSMAVNIVRVNAKGDMKDLYGDAASFFQQCLDGFPSMLDAKAKFWPFVPESWQGKWPKSFLKMIEAERNADVPLKFMQKVKDLGDDPEAARKHFHFGLKVWDTANAARCDINNHMNKLYIHPTKIASGKDIYTCHMLFILINRSL